MGSVPNLHNLRSGSRGSNDGNIGASAAAAAGQLHSARYNQPLQNKYQRDSSGHGYIEKQSSRLSMEDLPLTNINSARPGGAPGIQLRSNVYGQ